VQTNDDARTSWLFFDRYRFLMKNGFVGDTRRSHLSNSFSKSYKLHRSFVCLTKIEILRDFDDRSIRIIAAFSQDVGRTKLAIRSRSKAFIRSSETVILRIVEYMFLRCEIRFLSVRKNTELLDVSRFAKGNGSRRETYREQSFPGSLLLIGLKFR